MTISLDEKQFADANKNTNTDTAKRAVAAHVEKGRLWIFAIFIVIAFVIQSLVISHLVDKSQVNRELLYVQLNPNGTWDLRNYKPDDSVIFSKNELDNLLETFVKDRYGLQPETVKDDYTKVGYFLSDDLNADWVGDAKGQFNAAKKAAEVIANPKAFDRIDIKWGFADYYDQLDGNFNGQESKVIRTNVYFTRTYRSYSGVPSNKPPEKMILRLQWRLDGKAALKNAPEEYLRADPIGLEIISQDLIADPSGNQANTKDSNQ